MDPAMTCDAGLGNDSLLYNHSLDARGLRCRRTLAWGLTRNSRSRANELFHRVFYECEHRGSNRACG